MKKLYVATIINTPNGKNNPIVKFKLEDDNIVEKELNNTIISNLKWSKYQNVMVEYDDQNTEIKLIKKYDYYKEKKIYILAVLIFIIYLVTILLKFLSDFSNCVNVLSSIILFFLTGISLFIIEIFLLVYAEFKVKSNFIKSCDKETVGKVIAKSPFFTEFTKSIRHENTTKYYRLQEWRYLIEYQDETGTIYRYLSDEYNPVIKENTINLNADVKIKYNSTLPCYAHIEDNNEKKISIQTSKFNKFTTAKIVNIEQEKINSIEKYDVLLDDYLTQEYITCEYYIDGIRYELRSDYPVDCGMFFIGDEIQIQYDNNNVKDYAIYNCFINK